MALIDRLGIDVGITMSVEDSLRWAVAHGLRSLDVRVETGPTAFAAFTTTRCAALRAQAEAAGITLGLPTRSAVNIAEVAPFLAEAADQSLRASIDLAKALNADWVDVHAGYHCTSLALVQPRDPPEWVRMTARIRRECIGRKSPYRFAVRIRLRPP